MTCRILIVEDDDNMIESLKGAFSRLLGQSQVSSCGFANATETIAKILPDVAVLDIFEDQVEGDSIEAVDPPWDYLWNQHFCPVVFHSGHVIEKYQSITHPFVRYEFKNLGSQNRVANDIKEFMPAIEGLRTVRRELARLAGETLRHVSPLIWQSNKPATEQTDLILRVVRRRMAASLDYVAEHENQTQAWEQYIYPPIGGDLLTGDLIRVTDGSTNEPTAYRIILSPSCDLVLGRKSKTLEQVLVADCIPVSEFLAKAGINPQKLSESEHRKKLLTELSKDQVAGLTVLPMFPAVLPLMAANLKKLSLIRYTDIATKNGETKPFSRIASVDSPFRERLAWAYLQVAGRPGVPDVDREALADSIAQTIPSSTKA